MVVAMIIHLFVVLCLGLLSPCLSFSQEEVLIVPKALERPFRLFQRAQNSDLPTYQEWEEAGSERYHFDHYPTKDASKFSPWPWHYLSRNLGKTGIEAILQKFLLETKQRCSPNVSKLFNIAFADESRCTNDGYTIFFLLEGDFGLVGHADLDLRGSIEKSQLSFEEKKLVFLSIFPLALGNYDDILKDSPDNHLPTEKIKQKLQPPEVHSLHLWLSDFIDNHVRFEGE